jgi:DNA invertase Pin-like site-specific DNA recombinase
MNRMKPDKKADNTRRVAISYLRFSTPEQALGNSELRQIAQAEHWCASNGYTLSQDVVADRGRSAYHGAHRIAGNLGALLKRLKPGHTLLVEDCDRWSREPVLDSLTVLRDTVRKGIEVVFMRTGTRVTAENFDNPEVLYPNFFAATLGNAESKKKAERITAVWQAKHEAAKAGKPVRINRPPCWLEWDQDGQRYVEDKAKASVVRRLFELAAQGHGLLDICRLMQDTTPLTGSKKACWNMSQLRRILTSKSALVLKAQEDPSTPPSCPLGLAQDTDGDMDAVSLLVDLLARIKGCFKEPETFDLALESFAGAHKPHPQADVCAADKP